MNRKDRRRAQATAPKCSGSCGTRRMPQITSTHDGKARCLPCHSQHLTHMQKTPDDKIQHHHLHQKLGQHDDVQTTEVLIRAQELQEAIHKAILAVLPDRDLVHNPLIVQSLLLTASTFAHQAGIDERGFVGTATAMHQRIGSALAALADRTGGR